ncbi:MAG: M55 family metallopeptidase [Terriglobia bacterium]
MSKKPSMSRRDFFKSGASGAVVAAGSMTSRLEAAPLPAKGTDKPVKIFMVTDLEGVSGIFSELQCSPYEGPRWAESHQLLTGEVNAAVDGLMEGGATEVIVWDGHDDSQSLSALDINSKARLLTGQPVSPTLELNSSYSALIFVGQHAMAGAKKGILNHSYSSLGVQNMWVNNQRVGEIGVRVMLAGVFGVPVIMLSGDRAACKELRALVPQAECAEVKSGVSRTAGFMLPHPKACALIRETARRAMGRISEIPPYRHISGPVEVKIEFTTRGVRLFRPREGVEQLDARTWSFHGKDLREAWLKYSDF